MSVYTMIVIIVLIVFAAPALLMWLRRGSKAQDSEIAARMQALNEEIDALRERVETLERIHTDPATRLRDEIDGL